MERRIWSASVECGVESGKCGAWNGGVGCGVGGV